MRALRFLLQEFGLFPLVHHYGMPRIEGREHLAGIDRPLVIVANHSSHLDAPSLLYALPIRLRRRTLVAAAQDYFFMRGRSLAAFVSLVIGAIPFDRTHGSPKGIARSSRALEQGWSILIFPEGTRSPDGQIRPFKRGAARICLACRVRALPVYLEGATRVLPKGVRFPRRSRITIRFGMPLRPDPNEDEASLTGRLEEAVRSLGAVPGGDG